MSKYLQFIIGNYIYIFLYIAMGVTKKRPLVPPPMRSLRKARALTSSFHSITRELQARLIYDDFVL